MMASTVFHCALQLSDKSGRKYFKKFGRIFGLYLNLLVGRTWVQGESKYAEHQYN